MAEDDEGHDRSQSSGSESTGDEQSGRTLAFNAILAVFALIGLVAVVVGFGGVFVVLTGGTDDGGGAPEIQLLVEENLACDAFDGDPDVGHEGSVASTDRAGNLLGDVDRIPDGDDLLITMSGRVVDASAATAGGAPVNVTVGEDSIVVENGTAGRSYRVWIDSVDEEGVVQESSVVRSKFEICPDQSR
jgi:hypothetical protein